MTRLERLLAWACPDGALRLGVLTRGGLMNMLGPVKVLQAMIIPAPGEPVYRLAGMAPEWKPWARWYPPVDLLDRLPKFTAARGGIRFIPPPRSVP